MARKHFHNLHEMCMLCMIYGPDNIGFAQIVRDVGLTESGYELYVCVAQS